MKTMKRGQIIKDVILEKCKEREIEGYTNLQESDVSSILDTLSQKGIVLSQKEMVTLGFSDDNDSFI